MDLGLLNTSEPLRDLRSTCKMKHPPNCGAWAARDWATLNQPPSKLVLCLRRGDGVHNYGSEANEQKPSSLGCFCFWSLPSDLGLGRIKEPCGVPGTKDLGTTLKSRHPGRGAPKGAARGNAGLRELGQFRLVVQCDPQEVPAFVSLILGQLCDRQLCVSNLLT